MDGGADINKQDMVGVEFYGFRGEERRKKEERSYFHIHWGEDWVTMVIFAG